MLNEIMTNLKINNDHFFVEQMTVDNFVICSIIELGREVCVYGPLVQKWRLVLLTVFERSMYMARLQLQLKHSFNLIQRCKQ